jgi:2-polyprenyl-3-methyl-5-hydroxy-6-metoxy-1,4-benzoquinol methylase
MPAHTNYPLEHVDCLICRPGKPETLNTTGQHGLPANVVLCQSCGLGYLSPRWTKEAYQEFYSREYDKFYRTHLVGSAKSAVNGKGSAAKAVVPAFERMKAAGIMPSSVRKLLDIGSGSGGFILQARQVFPGASSFAIEPSSNCIPILQHEGITHLSSDVDSDWQKQQGDFDFIYMRHVLEHFMDPLAVLKKVRESLSENGLVYIAVPNSMKPSLPLISFYFRVVHTYYFNRFSLAAMAARAGLEPVLVIDGDSYNPNELVMVLRRGKVSNELTNSYDRQRAVFIKYIAHETSLAYRLKSILKRWRSRHAKPVMD